MKTYCINDIISDSGNVQDYFVGVFEEMEAVDIECEHRHSYYSIVWFTNGNGINRIDFEEFDITQNRVFLTKPSEIHNWSYSTNSKGYILLFEEHLAQQLNIEFNAPYIDLEKADILLFKEIFNRILESNINCKNKFHQDTIAISYLCSLINAKTISRLKTNPPFSIFKQIITNNYKTNYSIEQCAEILEISTSELNQICKNAIGLSPKQIQLDLKLIEAKRLLLYTSCQVSEVSYAIGFEDTSYFSRIFKNRTNITPSRFREKYQNRFQKS